VDHVGLIDLGDGVANGAEVIDQKQLVDADFGAEGCGAENPGTIGEFHHIAAHGQRHGECGGARRFAADTLDEGAPCQGKACMFGDLEGDGLAEFPNPAAADFRQRETRIGATYIGDDDFADLRLRHDGAPTVFTARS
jgi:hypothetical protein